MQTLSLSLQQRRTTWIVYEKRHAMFWGKSWTRVVTLVVVLVLMMLDNFAFAQSAEFDTDSGGYTAEAVHLSADRVEYSDDTISAEGNVAIELNGRRLLCNVLSMNRATGQFTASGNCVVYSESNIAAAEWLTYDPLTKTATMHKAAIEGVNYLGSQTQFNSSLFFWADTVKLTPERMELYQATFSSCDSPTDSLHYYCQAEHMEIYPKDRLVADKTEFFVNGKHLYTLPSLNVSIDPDRPQGRSELPQLGSNSTDGLFARTTWGYSFNKDNYGSLLVDYYSRTGFGLGLEHFYSLGSRGAGRAYIYRQGGDKTSQRYEISNNVYYDIDDDTRVTWLFNSNESELPGFQAINNHNSVFSLNRHTDTSNLMFSNISDKNSNNVNNTTWRLYYDIKLSPELTALVNADVSSSSSLYRSTNRFHYTAGLRHQSELFDSELMVENTTGDATYFLNRNPELTVRSRPIYLGDIPILASASVGHLTEGPSMFSANRTDVKIQIPDQIVDYGSGRFMLGGGIRQQFYSSGEQQYSLATRVGWLQELGDNGALRLDYSWMQPKGETPFQHDYMFGYENVTGGVEYRLPSDFAFSVVGGYNLKSDKWHNITPRIEFQPAKKWKIAAGSSFDPNTSTWRSLDTNLRLQLTDELSVSHWSIYDLVNTRLTYQDYQLDYEAHDWITSVVYRGVQNEVYLQFSMKAFPQAPLSIGPNIVDPVLPNPVYTGPR